MRGTIADLRAKGAPRAYFVILATPWPYHFAAAEWLRRPWTTDFEAALAFSRPVDAEHHLQIIQDLHGLTCEVASYPIDPAAVWPSSILEMHRTAARDFRTAVKNWRVPSPFDEATILPVERPILQADEGGDDDPFFDIVPLDSNFALIVRDAG